LVDRVHLVEDLPRLSQADATFCLPSRPFSSSKSKRMAEYNRYIVPRLVAG
jgi:hypothetical protein